MTDTSLILLPEWAEQAHIWAGWPSDPDLWGEDLAGAQEEVRQLLEALSLAVPLRMAIPAQQADSPRPDIERADERILPMGDVWLRDTGAIYACRGNMLHGLTFSFNGWGGKYDLPGDRQTATAMLAEDGVEQTRQAFVLEGGAIDHDGAGRLLTTRQCLLNPNRNSGWTEEIAEAKLKEAFSVERIIWLDEGLLGDHTDGHVDNIARFIGPGLVVCQTPSGSGDPNAEILFSIEAQLRSQDLDVVTIPSPGLITDQTGTIQAASHLNFVIANGAVIVPVYDEVHAGQAVDALQMAMPGYKIMGLPARHILSGGGAFHCMTQQVPKVTA